MQNSYEYYMSLAMEEAEKSVREGGLPFAVVVVNELGEVVWKDHDRVEELKDPGAHGEVNAIRALCKKFGILSLENMTFYTTSEPCPTCLTYCIKARVKALFYGVKTESTTFLPISAEEIARKSKKYPIKVTGGILADKCLFQRKSLLKNK